MEQYTWDDPRQIRQEYEAGREFKNGLGTRGLYEQSRVNERFYSGDQWHGVSSAADRPLVRQNIIKRFSVCNASLQFCSFCPQLIIRKRLH